MEIGWLVMSGFVVAIFWAILTTRSVGIPSERPSAKAMLDAKRRFIAEMNRRIGSEPRTAPQLRTFKETVVGWYDLKGSVVGVRFVARSCCKACYKLDGRQFSLLDVASMVRHIPPIHRDAERIIACACTLRPVTVALPTEKAKGAVRYSRPLH